MNEKVRTELLNHATKDNDNNQTYYCYHVCPVCQWTLEITLGLRSKWIEKEERLQQQSKNQKTEN